MKKILIIEDESRAARQLQKVIEACSFDYELLDILDSVSEVISWLDSHKMPDLIFMDIQLADGLSFEIFTHVEVNCPIIFTTAFDQYAIKAFKVNSVDYLLKPIKQEDLQMALNKFEKQQNQSISQDHLKSLISLLNVEQKEYRKGVIVKEGSGFKQLMIKDILYVYSSESITFARTKEKRFIIEETIEQFYKSLDSAKFFKINRGQVVSKSGIVKFESYFNHRLKLKMLEGGELEFVVSRQKTGDFRAWMNR